MNKVDNIFSIPVYKIQVPKDFISLVESLNREEMMPMDKEFGGISKNTYILHQKLYTNFKKFITNHINNYAYNILGIDSKNWAITQSWINKKDSNDSHHLHNHSNSLISGVFFYGKKDDKTPSLIFYNPFSTRLLGQMEDTFTLKPNVREDVEDNSTYFSQIYQVSFIPGTIILFPSFIPHRVQSNISGFIRESLAFNSFPKDSLGTYYGLNELKLTNHES